MQSFRTRPGPFEAGFGLCGTSVMLPPDIREGSRGSFRDRQGESAFADRPFLREGLAASALHKSLTATCRKASLLPRSKLQSVISYKCVPHGLCGIARTMPVNQLCQENHANHSAVACHRVNARVLDQPDFLPLASFHASRKLSREIPLFCGFRVKDCQALSIPLPLPLAIHLAHQSTFST